MIMPMLQCKEFWTNSMNKIFCKFTVMLSVTTSTTSKNIDKIIVIIRIFIAIIFVWLTFLTWFLWDIWYEKTCKYHPPISLDVTYELYEYEREFNCRNQVRRINVYLHFDARTTDARWHRSDFLLNWLTHLSQIWVLSQAVP